MASDHSSNHRPMPTLGLPTPLNHGQQSTLLKPPRDGMRPLWDMTSFVSRFRSYARITSPFNLLKSNEDLARAQALLYGSVQTRSQQAHAFASDTEARAALQLVDSAVHPETKQVVPKFFRRSAFTLFNTPLFVGIAMTPQTLPWVVGWQVVNQSYNAFSNYSNRSSTQEGAASELAMNFGLAVSVATGAAVAMKKLTANMATTGKDVGLLRGVAVRFAPAFAAGLGASVLNCLVVRKNELNEGVAVRVAPHGDAAVVGKSQIAAKEAMSATLQSRAILPVLSLLFPPLVSEFLTRRGGVWARPLARLPVVTAVVCASQLVSLPLSLAPWAWFMPVRVGDLEPEIAHNAAAMGISSTTPVYFNKGL